MKYLIGLIALVATPALAWQPSGPYCWPPDLEQCAEPDYQSSDCGRRYRARCTDMLLEAAEEEAAGRPLVETLNDRGDVITTRAVAAEPVDVDVAGFHGTFTGQVLRQQRESNAGFDWAQFAHRLERARWEDNGDAVQSCDEYVYERFYDYSRFEDEVAAAGTDWWAIYDAAWAEGGLMHTTWLRSRDDRQLFRLPAPEGLLGRNAFTTVRLDLMQQFNQTIRDVMADEYPDRQDEVEIFDFDPALMDAVVDARRPGVAHTWAAHQARGDALRAVDGNTLEALKQASIEFGGLVGRQQAAQQAVIDAGSAITLAEHFCRLGRNCHLVEQRVDEMIEAINTLARTHREVEQALREGQSMGCLEDEAFGLCDWSPRDFVRLLEGRFLAEREAEYDRCVANTGDDFDAVADATDLRAALCDLAPRYYYCRYGHTWPAGNDFTGGTRWVDFYFRHLEYFVRVLPMSTNPATGAPMLAESAQDSGENGDRRFGIDFAYTVGWNVDDLGDGDDYCATDVAVQATVSADARAFGLATGEGGIPHLYNAVVSVVADDEPQNGRQRTRVVANSAVLGQTLYAAGSGFDQVNIIRNPRAEASSARARLDVPVAGIPLYLEGWISGAVGANVSVQSGGERDCANGHIDIDVDARVEPYATVDGHANAGLDFYIVEAGVGVDLNLLSLRLPFTANVGVTLGPDVAEMTAEADLDLTVSTLAGRVKVFIEPFIGDGWSKVLFSWKGISKTYDLFGKRYRLPLDALSAALRQG